MHSCTGASCFCHPPRTRRDAGRRSGAAHAPAGYSPVPSGGNVTANGYGRSAQLMGNVVLRVAAYYAVLLGALILLERTLPGTMPSPSPGVVSGATTAFPPAVTTARPTSAAPSFVVAGIAMLGAVLLALPVAWVYVSTRAKRGYQQSVVQTLVILPMVVAGIVALVKDSLPLAFGLAAIVAAVRFRTALDDSKDAVYVFLATGVGLAAAVDLPVAFVVSALFNVAVLLLWQTDFGRTPPALDGQLAERRLRAIMEEMNRTGTFVARMDDEVFQDMPAEQLQAVADRAWRRARRNNPETPDAEGRREALLRVLTPDAPEARRAIEPVLDKHVKRWRFGSVVHAPDSADAVEYIVTLKRGTSPDELTALLQAAAPMAERVELE